MEHCRLLVCDLDNTLTKSPGISSWQLIWDYFGVDKATRSYGYRQYTSGAFTYQDWCAHDCRRLRSLGLRKDMFPEICRNVRPSPHLRDALEVLRQRGVYMAIVSGALDTILHTVLPWYEEFFSDTFLNHTIYRPAGSLEDIVPTPYDFDGKLKAVELLREKYAVPMEHTAFIGDGYNDLSVHGHVGLTIAFGSSHNEVKQTFNIDLPDGDFRDVLPYLIDWPD